MVPEPDRSEILDRIFRFYARMYDAAYECIEEFAKQYADSGVFDPDSPGWQEYVGELAALTISKSAAAFNHAEEKLAGLKYLFETEDGVLTHLDDEFDPIFAWVGVMNIDSPAVAPYVKHPLPKKDYWYFISGEQDGSALPPGRTVDGVGGLALPVLVDINDWISTGLRATSLVHAEAGVVYPEAPGFDELVRRLGLELTKLTPLLFAQSEHEPTGLKYYIADGEVMYRDIDARFGALADMVDVPDSMLAGHTREALPDPNAAIAPFTPAEKRRIPADAPPPRETVLALVEDNERDWDPVTGKLCLIHTTLGFIPAGIVSDSVSDGDGVKLHVYRCLLDSETDTSFYDLVERNELLLPPIEVLKMDFEQGGAFRLLEDVGAPRPVPLEAYYVNSLSQHWDPEHRRFAKCCSGVTRLDGTVKIRPTSREDIAVTDANTSFYRKLNEGEDFQDKLISSGFTVAPGVLEFALEDSLSYFSLIDTPRPEKARGYSGF